LYNIQLHKLNMAHMTLSINFILINLQIKFFEIFRCIIIHVKIQRLNTKQILSWQTYLQGVLASEKVNDFEGVFNNSHSH